MFSLSQRLLGLAGKVSTFNYEWVSEKSDGNTKSARNEVYHLGIEKLSLVGLGPTGVGTGILKTPNWISLEIIGSLTRPSFT
jgi:hypothetical protein